MCHFIRKKKLNLKRKKKIEFGKKKSCHVIIINRTARSFALVSLGFGESQSAMVSVVILNLRVAPSPHFVITGGLYITLIVH